MRQARDDGIEVTILRDRRDFRRTTRLVYAREIQWVAQLGGATAALTGLLALAAEQLVVAGVFLLGVVVAATYKWWRVELVVRRLPDWAYRPVTFRVSGRGVEIETEVSDRLVPWESMTEVLVTSDAYFFGSREKKGIILHRRSLSEAETAAIDSIVQGRRPKTLPMLTR